MDRAQGQTTRICCLAIALAVREEKDQRVQCGRGKMDEAPPGTISKHLYWHEILDTRGLFNLLGKCVMKVRLWSLKFNM